MVNRMFHIFGIILVACSTTQARTKVGKRAGPQIGCCPSSLTALYNGIYLWSYHAETNSLADTINGNYHYLIRDGMHYAINDEKHCVEDSEPSSINPADEYCLRGAEVEDLGLIRFTTRYGVTDDFRHFKIVTNKNETRHYLYDRNEEDCMPIVFIYKNEIDDEFANTYDEVPGTRVRTPDYVVNIPKNC